MDPTIKFIVEIAMKYEKSVEARDAALEMIFAKLAVIPLQRAFREKRIEVEYSCDCNNFASCSSDCAVAREMSLLAREAARKEPNATSFAWEDGRMIAIASKDSKASDEPMRGLQIECDHDQWNYCNNCSKYDLYRAIERYYSY